MRRLRATCCSAPWLNACAQSRVAIAPCFRLVPRVPLLGVAKESRDAMGFASLDVGLPLEGGLDRTNVARFRSTAGL